MSRLSIWLFCFILLSYKNDNYKVNTNEDLIIFFKNFIALNKNKFNINKTKYIIYPAPARILSRGSLKRVN